MSYRYLLLYCLSSFLHSNAMDVAPSSLDILSSSSTDITADNVNQLVLYGIEHIQKNGFLFTARAGSGQQAYDVNYILTNPLNRVHTLRNPVATKYFCRELLAYFRGSLDVNDGLAQASPIWKTLADENNKIASNYGYYVFHQKVPKHPDMTQYEWVIANLSKNLDSRKAFININQPCHKDLATKDFPCTLGMQFFVVKNHLCCTISSRSTDIYTGLPYDIGFFAFVGELVYKDLKKRLDPEQSTNLKLGYIKMKTNFTQIYDLSRTPALKLLEKHKNGIAPYRCDMPEIHDAQETLKDIYAETAHTPVIKWIHENAKR
jgi:thymidylate synthase